MVKGQVNGQGDGGIGERDIDEVVNGLRDEGSDG